MLNLDLLANGDSRRVNQDSIDRAMKGLTKSRKEFISACLEKDPSKRVTASALMKSKVLQEVMLGTSLFGRCNAVEGGGKRSGGLERGKGEPCK